MITTKQGVQFSVLRDEMWRIFPIVEQCFPEGSCMITCGTDSHSDDDPHTHGFALDFRTHGLDGRAIYSQLREDLTPNYTVILEDVDGTNEHIHVQVRKDLWRNLL